MSAWSQNILNFFLFFCVYFYVSYLWLYIQGAKEWEMQYLNVVIFDDQLSSLSPKSISNLTQRPTEGVWKTKNKENLRKI